MIAQEDYKIVGGHGYHGGGHGGFTAATGTQVATGTTVAALVTLGDFMALWRYFSPS